MLPIDYIQNDVVGEVEQRLLDMEFSRENVERAIALSGHNFERALDILVAEQDNEDQAQRVPQEQRESAAEEDNHEEQLKRIVMPDPVNIEKELQDLLCLAYNQLTQTALFNSYSLCEETNKVYGHKIILKDFFSSTQQLLKIVFDTQNSKTEELRSIFMKHYSQIFSKDNLKDTE